MWQADSWLAEEYEKAAARRKAWAAEGLPPHERNARLKEALRQSIGSFEPNPEHVPLLLEEADCGGYIRKRVELSATPGLTFPAYVLIPKHPDSRKLPGVIAVHGHGYGSRQILGLLPDGSPDPSGPGIYNQFAVELVNRGMAVIAPDIVGFGERLLQSDLRQDPNAPSSCYTMSVHLLMVGKTLTGLRIAEALRTLDYFAGLPEVDADRIGIMGFSGGGLISYITAALDARVRAAVLAGFPNTFKSSILAVHHCVCNYTPGILNYAELPELIGLIAPRPLFLESGSDDPIFPKEGFAEAMKELEMLYANADASDKLACDLFPGVHEISGRKSFDWLRRVLQ